MVDYNTEQVNAFIDKLLKLDDEHLVLVWTKCCGWMQQTTTPEAHQRLVAEFFDMPIWVRQAILYQIALTIGRVARSAAGEAARKARSEDPL